MASVKPGIAPEPPKGISLIAVMTALGKDGTMWLWDYKQFSDDQAYKLNQIYKDCAK